MLCHTETIQKRQILVNVRLTPDVPSTIRKIKAGEFHPGANLLRALIDTGATGSIISRKAADELKLAPLKKILVETGAGTVLKSAYRVNIHSIVMDEEVTRVHHHIGVEVTEFPGGDFDVILGMDLIMRGSLYVADGRFTFCI